MNANASPLVRSAQHLAQLLASYDRRTVEAFAEVCITVLDRMDPDPDLEDDDPREDDDFAASVSPTFKLGAVG